MTIRNSTFEKIWRVKLHAKLNITVTQKQLLAQKAISASTNLLESKS